MRGFQGFEKIGFISPYRISPSGNKYPDMRCFSQRFRVPWMPASAGTPLWTFSLVRVFLILISPSLPPLPSDGGA